MNLPNLNDVEIPKRMTVALIGIYLVKDISDLRIAGLVAGIIIAGMICQTFTDIKGKSKN